MNLNAMRRVFFFYIYLCVKCKNQNKIYNQLCRAINYANTFVGWASRHLFLPFCSRVH